MEGLIDHLLVYLIGVVSGAVAVLAYYNIVLDKTLSQLAEAERYYEAAERALLELRAGREQLGRNRIGVEKTISELGGKRDE